MRGMSVQRGNGCLWAVPGSHKTVPVSRKFRRKDPPGEGTEFSPVEPVQWDLEGAVPLEIPKGSDSIQIH